MKTLIIKTSIVSILVLMLAGFLLYNLALHIKPASEVPPVSRLLPNFLKPKPPQPSQTQKEPSLPSQPLGLFGGASQSQEDEVLSVVERSVKSVVSIVLTKELPIYERHSTNPFNDPFICQFFGEEFCKQFQMPELRQKGTREQEVGAGTGFFVRVDGLIITNKHVVAADDVSYTVVTNDGKKYQAKVLARDPVNDLALIKIEEKGFPVLSLGDSTQVKLGQTVIAIGNALGQFSNTVSKGIISGLSRSVVAQGSLTGPETLSGVIQTDAAINPGNSGGPLLNLKGEVIGINTAVAGGAQSIGFALPVNLAKRIIDQYFSEGKISYPFLGVRYMIITPEFAKEQSLPFDYGALILRGETPQDLAVVPGSPADKAGLGENDIILELNGKKITQENPLDRMITSLKVGEEVTMKVYSKGQIKTLKLILGERK